MGRLCNGFRWLWLRVVRNHPFSVLFLRHSVACCDCGWRDRGWRRILRATVILFEPSDMSLNLSTLKQSLHRSDHHKPFLNWMQGRSALPYSFATRVHSVVSEKVLLCVVHPHFILGMKQFYEFKKILQFANLKTTDTPCLAATMRAWHEHYHATRSLQSYCYREIVTPPAPRGASPRQTTDNTWMVLFDVASVKFILPYI